MLFGSMQRPALIFLLLLPWASCQEVSSLMEGLAEHQPQQPPASDGIEQNALGTFPAFPALPPPPTLPPPNFNSPMSKRVMSSMTDLPAVIKTTVQGDPKPLKNMISQMLGEGLLSKLITNPFQAAEDMGMPLEDLGFNRTEAFKKLKTDLEAQNITSLFNPEDIFGSDTRPRTTTEPPTTTPPTMYVEGKPMKGADFDEFITKLNPVDESGKPLFKKSRPAPMTPNPEQLAVEDAIRRSRMQASGLFSPTQFYDPTAAGTFPIGNDPLPQPVSADMANTLDMSMIDPRRVNEVSNLLRRAPMRNPVYSQSPMPIGIDSPDTLTPQGYPPSQSLAASLDPLNIPAAAFDSNIQNVVNTLRTKSVNSLSVGEVRDLQAVLQNFEQTIKTKEMFNKKRELQALQERLEQHRRLIEAQERQAMETKMKERQILEEQQRIENQLQQELSSFQSGFGLGQERPTLLPIHPTPPPFDSSLLERALNEQMMMGPELPPQMMMSEEFTTTTTRRPRPTTRRQWPMRFTTTTTTTTEAPQPEEEAIPAPRSSGGLLGGLSMGMSVLRRRPLPAENKMESEEESEQPRLIASRLKENPFNLVRYGPEENKKEEEREEEEQLYDEKEDRPAEAPMTGGRRMRAPATKKRPSMVTPAPPPLFDSPTLITPPPPRKASLFTEKSVEKSEELPVCECVEISQERMVGRWVPALASPSVISRIEEAIGVLLEEDAIAPTCAKLEFSVPRQSNGANRAKMTASFKTDKSEQLSKIRGNAVSSDSQIVEVKLNDLHGNGISAPFCVLKAEGRTVYDYMVVVTSQGPCNEAVLLVRDADAFFDGDNSELKAYFKHMINRKKLEPLQAVSFSNDCSAN